VYDIRSLQRKSGILSQKCRIAVRQSLYGVCSGYSYKRNNLFLIRDYEYNQNCEFIRMNGETEVSLHS
jgi:hypothetical protein